MIFPGTLFIAAPMFQVFSFQLIAIAVEFGTSGLPQDVSTDGSRLVLALYLVPGLSTQRLQYPLVTEYTLNLRRVPHYNLRYVP